MKKTLTMLIVCASILLRTTQSSLALGTDSVYLYRLQPYTHGFIAGDSILHNSHGSQVWYVWNTSPVFSGTGGTLQGNNLPLGLHLSLDTFSSLPTTSMVYVKSMIIDNVTHDTAFSQNTDTVTPQSIYPASVVDLNPTIISQGALAQYMFDAGHAVLTIIPQSRLSSLVVPNPHTWTSDPVIVKNGSGTDYHIFSYPPVTTFEYRFRWFQSFQNVLLDSGYSSIRLVTTSTFAPDTPIVWLDSAWQVLDSIYLKIHSRNYGLFSTIHAFAFNTPNANYNDNPDTSTVYRTLAFYFPYMDTIPVKVCIHNINGLRCSIDDTIFNPTLNPFNLWTDSIIQTSDSSMRSYHHVEMPQGSSVDLYGICAYDSACIQFIQLTPTITYTTNTSWYYDWNSLSVGTTYYVGISGMCSRFNQNEDASQNSIPYRLSFLNSTPTLSVEKEIYINTATDFIAPYLGTIYDSAGRTVRTNVSRVAKNTLHTGVYIFTTKNKSLRFSVE